MEPRVCIVVGSGPAGVSCAMGLLENNCNVIMLDIGLELSAETQNAVENLRNTPSKEWTAKNLEVIKEKINVDTQSVPQKRHFGEAYAIGGSFAKLTLRLKNFFPSYSMARGGLSQIWGSACLPANKIESQKMFGEDMTLYYKKIEKAISIAGEPDDLDNFYKNIFSMSIKSFLSEVFHYFNSKYEDKKLFLNRQGVYWGAPRLAIDTRDSERGCKSCGLCMYGCPYGSIFSSSQLLNQLIKNKKFDYQKNAEVISYSENNGQVQVEYIDRVSNEVKILKGDKLFLAAGALPTTAIVLKSEKLPVNHLSILENQIFLAPLFLFKKINYSSPKITLSCGFIGVKNKVTDNQLIHLQVYPASDYIEKALRTILPKKLVSASWFKSLFLDRLAIVQIFYPSSLSSSGIAELTKDKAHPVVEITGHSKNPEYSEFSSIRFFLFLSKIFFKLGAVFFPVVKRGQPGNSFHIGGTLPMKNQPKAYETDLNGKLFGRDCVWVVDASILPYLPASTITFSIMANAYRIGFSQGRVV